MAEAEKSLTEEIEKVRERARLQALAQGLSAADAEVRAAAAVEEFCSRRGVRIDGKGKPVLPAAVRRPAGRNVDLGSSPLRTSSSAAVAGQPLRISELLKKFRTAPPRGPLPGVHGPSLSALLERVRSRELPGAAPAPAPVAAGRAPSRPPAPPAVVIRRIPVHEQVAPEPGGEAVVAAAASVADRRQQLLEEFDRTYAEVQTMIEERIAESQGEGPPVPAPGGGPAPEYTSEDIRLIARDLERLRGGLQSMLSLCDELVSQLSTLLPRDGSGGTDGGNGR